MPRQNPYRELTYRDWSKMSWRERAQVRRHRKPPRPPLQVFLDLSDQQQRELQRIARERRTTAAALASEAVGRFLTNQRRIRKVKSTNNTGKVHNG